MKIKLDKGAYMPERAHPTDAGLDLRTPIDFELPGWTQFGGPGEAIIDTGVHIQLPPGYYGKIESKSGLNVKNSIVSLGGVIDEGYTGSIKVKLYSFQFYPAFFKSGDKIAQLIIQPYSAPPMVQVDELDKTERGDNGFGSTGR